MKIWHRLAAWNLDRRIHRQHRKLAKFVRQSAYEINAWKQDIAFLEESRDYHRALLGAPPPLTPSKVVSIDDAEADGTEAEQTPRKNVV